MVGWHPRLSGQEFEQTLGDSEGQGNLACCSPRGHKELDMTQQQTNKTKQEESGCISTKVHQYPILCGISDLKGTESFQD